MKKSILSMLFLVMITCVCFAQKVSPKKIVAPDNVFLSQLQEVSKSINLKKYKAPSLAQKEFIGLFKNTGNASTWSKKQYKAFMISAGRVIGNMNLSSDPDDGGEVFSDPDDGGEVFLSPKKFIRVYNSLAEICTDVITQCQWKKP